MSERLFRFLLSEISVVRLRCRNEACAGVIEIPVEKLSVALARCECPLCHQQFDTGVWEGGNLLQIFAKSLERLKSIDNRVQIEFVLPDPERKNA